MSWLLFCLVEYFVFGQHLTASIQHYCLSASFSIHLCVTCGQLVGVTLHDILPRREEHKKHAVSEEKIGKTFPDQIWSWLIGKKVVF